MNARAARAWVTLAGLGEKCPMPGTVGSAAALAALAVLPRSWAVSLALLSAGTLVFGVACHAYLQGLGNGAGKTDPHEVIADEVIGLWVAFLGLPLTLFTAVAGFALFRFFDIAKPYPVNRMERLPGVWGVFLDDIVAGLLANVLLRIALRMTG